MQPRRLNSPPSEALAGGVEIAGAVYFWASQVAEAVKVSRQTLWRWRKDRKIPAGRLFRDRRILFSTEEFEAVRLYANRLEPALLDTGRDQAEGTPFGSRAPASSPGGQ